MRNVNLGLLCLINLLIMKVGYAQNKIDLYESPTKLRGANMYQQEKYAEKNQIWNPSITLNDLIDLRSAGANFVNLSVPGTYDVSTYAPRADFTLKLDQLINYAIQANLFVVISFRTAPGRGEGNITGDGKNNKELFFNTSAQSAFVQMWKDVAKKYKSYPQVIGYDLLVEPHDVGMSTWKSIAQKTVNAIRLIDTQTPILISPHAWGTYDAYESWTPLTGQGLVYTLHQYEPYNYTHHNKTSNEVQALDSIYSVMANWINRYQKPVIVNEFGLKNGNANPAKFMSAQINKIEQLGMGHAGWIWEVEYDPDYTFDTFDFKDNTSIMNVYQQSWSKNTDFAGVTTTPTPTPVPTPEPAPLPIPVPTPIQFNYDCGSTNKRPAHRRVSRMFIERDCDSNIFSLNAIGSRKGKVQTQKSSLSSLSNKLTIKRLIKLEKNDSVIATSKTQIDYKLNVIKSGRDGFSFEQSSPSESICLSNTGSIKVLVHFGPLKIKKVLYPGKSIDLATMSACK